jgi:hypothetical protein
VTHTSVTLTHCANCGRELDGPYCGACGQKATPLNPTFHDLLHDFIHEFLHVDGRIFQSVRLLLTRPGFLTQEYFQGRRARYVSPIRLYLIFSVVFFLMSAAVSKPLSEEDRAEMAREPSGRLAQAAAKNPDFASTVEAWMPRMMFVLVPVLGLITAVVMRSSGRNYPQHLYFAFHLQAALFAIGAVWMLLRFGSSEVMDVIADLLTFVVSAWYGVTAFRTAYGGSWGRAIGRAAVVGGTYLVAYGLAVFLLVSFALFA